MEKRIDRLARRYLRKAYRPQVEDMSGYKTFKSPDNKETGPANEESEVRPGNPRTRHRALPAPPENSEDSRVKNLPSPSFNVPSSGGDTDQKVPVRTVPQPGEERGHPYKTNPHQRRTMEGSDAKRIPPVKPIVPSGGSRQREQKGEARRYYRQYYKRNKNKIITQQKRRYRQNRRTMRVRRKRELYRDPQHKEKFERKPGGGTMSPAERTKKWREENKKALDCFAAHTFFRELKKPESEMKDRPDSGKGTPKGQPLLERPKNKTWVKPMTGRPGLTDDDTDRPLEKGDYGFVYEGGGSARVVPMNKDFHRKQASFHIADLLSKTGRDIQERAVGLPSRQVYSKDGEEHYLVGTRTVRIIESGDGVKVACSCPFWQYQGPEYWAKKEGFLLGSPVGTATRPTQRDPSQENYTCKHVVAVLLGRLQHIRKASTELYGYKVVSKRNNKFWSLMDSSQEIPSRIGSIVRSGRGFYLGTTEVFVRDYYQGMTDYPDALLVYSYSESDLIRGNPDEEGEVVVRKAKLVRFYDL